MRPTVITTALTATAAVIGSRAAAKSDRFVARALVPYAAWTGFATALNASIWWRSRSRASATAST